MIGRHVSNMAKNTSSTKRRRRLHVCGDLSKRGMSDLNGVIDFLSNRHQLVHVKTEVDPRFELGAVAYKFHGNKPVLFERVKGSRWSVFTGLYWNRAILAEVFGVPGDPPSFLFSGGGAG